MTINRCWKQLLHGQLMIKRAGSDSGWHCVKIYSSLNPLKKDGLSVRIIGKPQVSFLLAVLLFMSIFLSWIKQQDLAVVILYKSFSIAST